MDLDSPGELLFKHPGRMKLHGYAVDIQSHMCAEHRYKGIMFAMRFWIDPKNSGFTIITDVRAIGARFDEYSCYAHYYDGPFSVGNATGRMLSLIEEMHFRVDVGVWAPTALVHHYKVWSYNDMVHEIYMLLKERKGDTDGTDDAG